MWLQTIPLEVADGVHHEARRNEAGGQNHPRPKGCGHYSQALPTGEHLLFSDVEYKGDDFAADMELMAVDPEYAETLKQMQGAMVLGIKEKD